MRFDSRPELNQVQLEPLRTKPLAEFLRQNPIVDFLVDDCLRRGWLYTCTAQPGGGKTGFGVRMALAVATGDRLAKFQCEQAAVVFIAAENPEDVNMRFRIAIERMQERAGRAQVDMALANIHVLDKSFTLAGRTPELLRLVDECNAGLVIVDTDQAISLGDGSTEVDNDDRMAHAKRLREITRCIGRPTVLDFCHPNATAGPDSLRPRGGSALLAEIDGNIFLSRDDNLVTVKSDPGKFRGEAFELTFLSTLQQSQYIVDRKGRPIKTPYIDDMTLTQEASVRVAAVNDQNKLLKLIAANPHFTQNDLAAHMGWMLAAGEPNKPKTSREVGKLRTQGFLGVAGLKLTPAGKRAAKEVL